MRRRTVIVTTGVCLALAVAPTAGAVWAADGPTTDGPLTAIPAEQGGTAGSAGLAADQAYQAFRAGDRAAFGFAAQAAMRDAETLSADPAFQSFRAGERAGFGLLGR